MSKLGTRLIRSAEEALAIAQGKVEPARVIAAEEIDVAAIRKKMKLSQGKFAKLGGNNGSGRGLSPNGSFPGGANVDAQPGALLKLSDYRQKVSCIGVAARAEHAHQTLRRSAGNRRQVVEANRRIDVIANDGFTGLEIAGEKGLEAFGQQSFAKLGIALRASLDGLLE
jgi:hypothetical protein